MLQPARTKFRKLQKGRVRGNATSGISLHNGDFGLQATERGIITSRQIESSRVAMSRLLKKGGKIWIRIFPDSPITKKPAETRMGKGKGNVEGYAAKIKPGRVLFELEGVEWVDAKEALTLAAHKLPVKTKIINREKFLL